MSDRIRTFPKKTTIVIMLMCIAVAALLGADSYNKNRYRNPVLVGENFVTAYLFEDPEEMKKWSWEDLDEQIDNLGYIPILMEGYAWDPDGIELVGWSRIGKTVVASYGYRDSLFDGESSDTVLCTVALQPRHTLSLWEKLEAFIERSTLPSSTKERWFVVNFFSDSRMWDYLERYRQEPPSNLGLSADEQFEELIEGWKKQREFENNWSLSQIMRQHTEMKILYTLYLEYLKQIGVGKWRWKD